jgi:hypothetical protein
MDATMPLPGESPPAFAALQEYLALGPQRSLAQVASRIHKSARLVERWSSQYHWQQRAATWDKLVAAAAQASYLEASAAIAKSHAGEAAELRARALARLQALPLDTLPPAVALKLWIEAIRIERLSLGLPTDNTHATASVQQQVNATIHSTLPEDELEAIYQLTHDKHARDLATQLFDALMMGDADMGGDAPDDTDVVDDTDDNEGDDERESGTGS